MDLGAGAPAVHLNQAVFTDGVNGVGHQIQKDLLELGLIAGDNRQIIRPIGLYVDIVVPGIVSQNGDGLVFHVQVLSIDTKYRDLGLR